MLPAGLNLKKCEGGGKIMKRNSTLCCMCNQRVEGRWIATGVARARAVSHLRRKWDWEVSNSLSIPTCGDAEASGTVGS